MNIRWLGHSCFLFTNQEGLSILTDPFHEKVGYPVPRVKTDIVTISHHHHDHDAIQVLPGKPHVIEGEGLHNFSGLSIQGTSTFHDAEQGAKRGMNTPSPGGCCIRIICNRKMNVSEYHERVPAAANAKPMGTLYLLTGQLLIMYSFRTKLQLFNSPYIGLTTFS